MNSSNEPMTEALIGAGGALTGLASLDADIARALARYGAPPDRSMPQGFETLIRIIIGQQISRLAASSVWRNMVDSGFDRARTIARAEVSALKALGLSRQKAEYIHGIAVAVDEGSLDLGSLEGLPGEAAAAKLVALRGIGDWTADNYRLFALMDMDAWPYNDLALQEGMKILKALESRPDGGLMRKIAEPWQPYRGAGALMLWHIYAHHRRDATPSSI